MKKIKLKAIKESLNKIPNLPGVYFFIKNEKYIYIGKANSLRSRLSSYYSQGVEGKAKEIARISDFISYIEVNSEIEALLLEAKLIKKYKPHYNSSLRDDKSPLYIIITKDKYPRVLSARKTDIFSAKYYYGPFPTSGKVKEVLKILRRLFPFAQHSIGKKPCLYSHINLCDPCPNIIENTKDIKYKEVLNKKYQTNIKYINGTLSNRFSFVTKEIRNEMNMYSKSENYEEANELKKKLDTFDYITQPRIDINELLRNPNFTEDMRKIEVKQLLQILQNNQLVIDNLHRIECFDVSHLSGIHTTASMVTFMDGKADKSLYRHFKIRSKAKSDDLLALKEVIKRRKKYFKIWGKPDLVIVDGGKTQVKTFYKYIKNTNMPVIGLAKRQETLIFPYVFDKNIKYREYKLPRGNARNLIQRIRNEAHRFAISYHRKLLTKSYLV